MSEAGEGAGTARGPGTAQGAGTSADPGTAAGRATGPATDPGTGADRPLIAIVGARPDDALVAALDGHRVAIVQLADLADLAWPPAPAPFALVIEALPERPEGEKAVRLGALLGALPAAIPVVTLIDETCASDLALPARAAGRLMGLHLVRPATDGARPLAELAVPLGADPELADVVLALLERAGLEAHPVWDQPGRVVRRLAATLGAERERPGADDASLAAALANEGYRIAGDGGAGTTEIDRLVTAAGLWPDGPFAIAGRMGLRALIETLATLRAAATGAGDAAAVERFTPAPALWRVATV